MAVCLDRRQVSSELGLRFPGEHTIQLPTVGDGWGGYLRRALGPVPWKTARDLSMIRHSLWEILPSALWRKRWSRQGALRSGICSQCEVATRGVASAGALVQGY